VSALGHLFGPDLRCETCARHWSDHQLDPQPCPYPADTELRKPLSRKRFLEEMREVVSDRMALARFMRRFYGS
jgi:hypothetical protein